jgi:glucan biosynthesis protein C
LFSFLAEASYSIYLTHHVLVIIGGVILIKLGIGGYLGFFILILFTISLSILIHHFLISKIDLLAFLYNGRKLKKGK